VAEHLTATVRNGDLDPVVAVVAKEGNVTGDRERTGDLQGITRGNLDAALGIGLADGRRVLAAAAVAGRRGAGIGFWSGAAAA